MQGRAGRGALPGRGSAHCTDEETEAEGGGADAHLVEPMPSGEGTARRHPQPYTHSSSSGDVPWAPTRPEAVGGWTHALIEGPGALVGQEASLKEARPGRIRSGEADQRWCPNPHPHTAQGRLRTSALQRSKSTHRRQPAWSSSAGVAPGCRTTSGSVTQQETPPLGFPVFQVETEPT